MISLYQGQLNIIAPDTVVTLDAGLELEYNRVTGLLTVRNMERQQPDWMREIINFDRAQVMDIFRSLEKIYGVTIDITGFRLTEDEIELKFEEGLSLDEVMFFMSSITGTFDYIISGDVVYVNNKQE